MTWLGHLKIATKISLIVALLSVVTVAAVTFAIYQTSGEIAELDRMVNKTDVANVALVRVNRAADAFRLAVFELAVSTSDEDNAFHLGKINEARVLTLERLAATIPLLPEQATRLEVYKSKYSRAFDLCAPVIAQAASTIRVEDMQASVLAMKTRCSPALDNVSADLVRLTDEIIAASRKEANDLRSTSDRDRTIILVGVAAGLSLALAIAMLIAIQGMSRPIGALKAVMASFANNDLAYDVPGLTRRDEIGEMARTVEVFKTNALEVQQMRATEMMREADLAALRKADMMKLASAFESAVGSIIQTVSSSALELEGSARSLTTTAGSTENLSKIVASAADEASNNVQSVASATEEMSSSVNEISRQVQESARIAADAVNQAQTTNARVLELADSARTIGDVVQLISTIAEQTNLLALNATIESARAGEAGRGFAVVASEVKALAQQTAQATGDITRQIASIQAATAESVTAIRNIAQTIGRISEISSTIAAAVEEQGAATQEIARNVQQAAQGTTEVAANISDLQRGSSQTGTASAAVLAAAGLLSQESGRLSREVESFLTTVRAA